MKKTFDAAEATMRALRGEKVRAVNWPPGIFRIWDTTTLLWTNEKGFESWAPYTYRDDWEWESYEEPVDPSTVEAGKVYADVTGTQWYVVGLAQNSMKFVCQQVDDDQLAYLPRGHFVKEIK